MSESDQAVLHKQIEEEYLVRQDNEKSNSYKAAVHLECAPDFLQERHQQAKLARLNLEAAKYCEGVYGFDKAVVALQMGLACLNNEERCCSEKYSPLTFEMMEGLAKAQLFAGDLDACKATTKEGGLSRIVRQPR
jgi:hypothetical protein